MAEKTPQHLIEAFTDEEIKIAIETIDKSRMYRPTIAGEFLRKRDKAILLFACYTGLRPSEALTLEWKDIDFSNNKIKIYPYINKERNPTPAILTKKARDVILDYKKYFDELLSCNFIFPSLNTLEPIHVNGYSRRLRKILKEAGIHEVKWVSTSGQPISNKSLYSARKYYGTKIYSKSKDIYLVMRALRQSKKDSALPYILIEDNTVRNEIDDLI